MIRFQSISRGIIKNHKTRLIVFIFAAIILIGTFLLMLPIASNSKTSFSDALFTAASATCVTGLSIYNTGTYWTVFGQVVILLLIQLGGIGFMSIITMVFIMMKKNISLSERMLIKESLGIETNDGLVRIAKHIVIGTLFFEFTGAVLLSFRFVPQYNLKGIYYAVFHSVSAFCNAGFDVFEQGNSMMNYSTDAYVNIVLILLIIIGGFGFIVWEDLLKFAKNRRRLNLHTKIVLTSTALLVVVGTVMFFIFEHNNAGTIGNMSVPNQLLASLFQSVTTRTAGFCTVDQNSLTGLSKLFTLILMYIGGAPASTAGGIKVVTVFVIIVSAIASIRGEKEIVIFKRQIDNKYVLRSIAIIIISMTAIIVAIFIMLTSNDLSMDDIVFEAFSASGTVGLSLGITPLLNTVDKLTLVALMFFGRIGVHTVAISFLGRSTPVSKITYPHEKIIIG